MVHMMDYFKSEYKDAERVIKKKVSWANPREIAENVKITNETKIIEFNIGENEYKIDLTRKRKPKN